MKKYCPCYQALNFIRFFMTLASFLLNYLSLRFLSFNIVLMWCFIALFWSVTIFVGFIYLPVYFSNTYYGISKTFITKNSGVFYISRQTMRSQSMAFLTAVVPPFGKYTGCNLLIVHAMGGNIIMAFLSYDDINEISAALEKEIKKPNKI